MGAVAFAGQPSLRSHDFGSNDLSWNYFSVEVGLTVVGPSGGFRIPSLGAGVGFLPDLSDSNDDGFPRSQHPTFKTHFVLIQQLSRVSTDEAFCEGSKSHERIISGHWDHGTVPQGMFYSSSKDEHGASDRARQRVESIY